VVRKQEVDLLLGYDDRYRPLSYPLPPPMQRHTFRIRHPHFETPFRDNHTLRNTLTSPKHRFWNAVSGVEMPFQAAGPYAAFDQPARVVVQPIGRARHPPTMTFFSIPTISMACSGRTIKSWSKLDDSTRVTFSTAEDRED